MANGRKEDGFYLWWNYKQKEQDTEDDWAEQGFTLDE
jgi:hypothetical protein